MDVILTEVTPRHVVASTEDDGVRRVGCARIAVGTGAAEDNVVVGLGQRIDALGTGGDDVTAEAGGDDVVSELSEDVIVAGAGVDRIVARLAVDLVRAATPIDGVVAITAVEFVGTTVTKEGIVVLVAKQLIGTGTAIALAANSMATGPALGVGLIGALALAGLAWRANATLVEGDNAVPAK